LEKEKPPVFGMIARGGNVVIKMLENVKQKTIEPLIKKTIAAGTLVYTDEYDIYARLEAWVRIPAIVNTKSGDREHVVVKLC
jgi:transposase